MGHIFISYKSDERDLAETIRAKLHAWKQYATWMDIYDIPKGAYWPDEINKGLEAADVVIGLMSPLAVESRNVKNEWDWAIVNGKRLILLMVKPCKVPMNYVSINYIDFTRGHDFQQLQTALEKPFTPTTSADPYLDYLQKLYKRINGYLAQKVITRRPDDDQTPEPIRLHGAVTENVVLFEKQDEIDPLYQIGGIQAEKQTLYDDFAEAFAHYDGQTLLLGAPGAGKTITLLHFGRDAVVRRIQDRNAPLPILAIISTWDAYQNLPLVDWLSASYGAPPDAKHIIETGKTLLLLDGLDELGSEHLVDPRKPDGAKFDPRRRFLDGLAALIEKTSSLGTQNLELGTSVLVTCRPNDYAQIGQKIALKGAITLQPLDDTQIATYLRDQPELLQVIREDKALREVAETPLLLSIFAFVYQGMSADERAALANLKHAGNIRDKIFNAYIDERYKHEERRLILRGETMSFSLVEMHNILTRLALRNLIDYSATTNFIRLYHLVREVDLAKVEQKRIESFIELSTSLNLLALDSENLPRRPTFRFIHLLLRDTLISSRNKLESFRIVDQWDGYNIQIYLHNAPNVGQPDDIGFARLLADLRDVDWDIRNNAAILLGQTRDARAVDALAIALHDSDIDVRRASAYALQEIGTLEALVAYENWRLGRMKSMK